MSPTSHGTERQYTDAATRLASLSESFLEDLKNLGVKPMSSSKDKLDKIADLVSVAELGKVKNMETVVRTFNQEVEKLAKRFRITRDSFKESGNLVNFIEHYNSNPTGAHKNLLSSMDASISQIDSVITAYSRIASRKKSARKWIKTVLASHSSDKTAAKARRSNQILNKLESELQEIRALSHSAKYDLLKLRNSSSKGAKLSGMTHSAGNSRLMQDLKESKG